MKICTHCGTRPSKARGMCSACYQREWYLSNDRGASNMQFPLVESPWTHERVAELEAHVASGNKSANQIAAAMGMTKNMIIGKCYRDALKLPGRNNTQKRLPAELLDLWASGMSMVKIAAKYGVGRFSVARAVQRMLRADPHKQRLVPVYKPTPNPFPARGCCVYPHGDPGDPDFHFCGAAAVSQEPYCVEHTLLCWHKPTPQTLAAIEFYASRVGSRIGTGVSAANDLSRA